MDLDEFIRGRKKIYIFGAGANGVRLSKVLRSKKCVPSGFMDNSEKMWNNKRGSKRVFKPQLLEGGVIITCLAYKDAVKSQLLELGYAESDIYIAEGKDMYPKGYISSDDAYIYNYAVKGGVLEALAVRCRNLKYSGWLRMHGIREKKPKRYKVSICAIFYNEAPYLKEWLDYYILIGVEHFYLYNNISTDNYEEVLKPYVDDGIVTLQYWDVRPGQAAAYTDCISKYRDETQWMGFIDLDEFIYLAKCNSIGEFLDARKRMGSVLIHWKVFGSSGLVERDVKSSVLKDFTLCRSKLSSAGKCFWNTDYDAHIENGGNVIHHVFYTECKGKRIPPVDCNGCFCEWDKRLIGKSQQDIQLNHYIIKSLSEYHRKTQKPSTGSYEKFHSDDRFCCYDRGCTTTETAIWDRLQARKREAGNL